jgi:ketosteroid isomerase-like protein
LEKARGDAGLNEEERFDLVRRALAAWNASDLEMLDALTTPDSEFVPAVAGAVDGGTVRGIDAFRRFIAGVREVWAEPPRVEAEEFRHIGERVLLEGRLVAQGRGGGVEVNQAFAALVDFEGDKISRIHNFLDPAEALKVATQKEHA